MDIDATKTPRTHAAWKKAYDVQELAKFMVELSQQLEVELNTAIVNEAFAENKVYMLEKQLKQANEHLNESNKIIRQQQLLDEENLMLKERIKRLEDWKQSALAVEREWDANTVATMLGAKLGESQRKVIQREVPLLIERIKRLEDAGDALYANCDPSRWDSTATAARKVSDQNAWLEAKEANCEC